ncbi:MAG: hypothetical protein ACP5JG_08395, partial [Anaerolineae bacterium]
HGDRAQFMRASLFRKIGGFPDIPLMEDVEMARALRRRGKLKLAPSWVVTSSRRYLELGSLRYFLSVIGNVLRYLYFGATPEEIQSSYRSSREAIIDQQDQETEANYGSANSAS